MASTELSRAEYLKKYLDGPVKEKKKKKKNATVQGMRVIDDDTYLPIPIASEDKVDIKKLITKFGEDDVSEDEDELLLAKAKNAEAISKLKNDSFTVINSDSGDNNLQTSNVKMVVKAEPSSPSSQTKKLKSKKRKNDDYISEDLCSPNWRKKNNDSPSVRALESDSSPPRRRKDDLSPPRRRENDNSPPRRRKDDLSPPRRRENDNSSPRRRKDDLSLPRRRENDNSPPRRRKDDLSPPRRRRNDNSSPKRLKKDESPSRRRRNDNSPVRKYNAQSSNRLNKSDDNSPIRKSKPNDLKSKVKEELYDNSPPRKMEKKLSPSRVEPSTDMKDDDDGRFAAPRKRVSQYNRRRGREPEDAEKKERESTKQKEWDEKYKKWRGGEAQSKQREEKLKEMEEVMQEGFTRHADNEAMNEYLKSQIHDELDPMAQYYRTKQHKVEMKSGVVYPKYKGNWPPNRYNIPPGYRWDGVNRSNGFEGKLALAENKKRAQETEAYRAVTECGE